MAYLLPKWTLESGHADYYYRNLVYAKFDAWHFPVARVEFEQNPFNGSSTATYRTTRRIERYTFASRAAAMRFYGITGADAVCPSCGHALHIKDHARTHLDYLDARGA